MFVRCTYTHTHTHTHNMPLAKTWMELEGIMQSKIIETGKDKYHMLSFPYKLKKEKKKQTKKLQPNLYIQRKDWWLSEVRAKWWAQ